MDGDTEVLRDAEGKVRVGEGSTVSVGVGLQEREEVCVSV